MDIRNSLDGLKSVLGISPAESDLVKRPAAGKAAEPGSLTSDSATLSSAGTEVAQTATDGGVRTDKVAAVQAALADGTYQVPASAVASKVVDAMLGQGR